MSLDRDVIWLHSYSIYMVTGSCAPSIPGCSHCISVSIVHCHWLLHFLCPVCSPTLNYSMEGARQNHFHINIVCLFHEFETMVKKTLRTETKISATICFYLPLFSLYLYLATRPVCWRYTISNWYPDNSVGPAVSYTVVKQPSHALWRWNDFSHKSLTEPFSQFKLQICLENHTSCDDVEYNVLSAQ